MTWSRAAGVLPGIGVSLMPKLICPLCWPAYAGVLSTVGLGFLVNARNLLIVTGAFLIIAVSALAFRARRRRGYGPAVAPPGGKRCDHLRKVLSGIARGSVRGARHSHRCLDLE